MTATARTTIDVDDLCAEHAPAAHRPACRSVIRAPLSDFGQIYMAIRHTCACMLLYRGRWWDRVSVSIPGVDCEFPGVATVGLIGVVDGIPHRAHTGAQPPALRDCHVLGCTGPRDARINHDPDCTDLHVFTVHVASTGLARRTALTPHPFYSSRVQLIRLTNGSPTTHTVS